MKIFLKILFVSGLSLSFASTSLAAEIRLETHKTTVLTQEQFVVDVFPNSSEPINAMEGELHFTPSLLKVVNILESGSVVSVWIEKPELTSGNNIAFSGIIPGGVSGPSNLLFSVVFEAERAGPAQILPGSMTALVNNGLGTPAPLELRGVNITAKLGDSMARKNKIEDTEPPEDFKPSISSTPDLYEGKSFLVFSTQDKKSGMSHFEVREGRWGWLSGAESPHVLDNQSLDEDIYVKAIDKNGNERVVKIEAQNEKPWWKNEIVTILVIVVALVCLKKLWQKPIK